jgi:hypothetical protein
MPAFGLGMCAAQARPRVVTSLALRAGNYLYIKNDTFDRCNVLTLLIRAELIFLHYIAVIY